MSLSLIMLRAGSADTIIARRLWCIRPSTPTFFRPDGAAPERFALVVSALVPYKRIDLAIDACRLAGVPLKIVGDGPERAALERAAASAARRRVSRPAVRRGDPRALPPRRGRAAARRRRLRHRPARSAGVRPAGGRARPRRRARDGRAGRNRPARRRAGAARRSPTRSRDALDAAVRLRPRSAATPSGSAATRFGDEIEALVREDAPEATHGEPAQPAARRLSRHLRRAARH